MPPSRVVLRLAVLWTCLVTVPVFGQPPAPPAATAPPPVVKDVVIAGATVFSKEDVLWLLGLRLGTQMPAAPEDVARLLERRYHQDGYTEATVKATFEEGPARLRLSVDEGRIDDVEVVGIPADLAARLVDDLARRGVKAGEVFNRDATEAAVGRFVRPSDGGLYVGPVRPNQLTGSWAERRARSEALPDDISLVTRDDRRVLVVPLRRRLADFSLSAGATSREDIFNPVDGFAPRLGFNAIAYDRGGFGHTFVTGSVSYKFGRDDAGYSLGIERPLLSRPRVFVGGEIHDMTATDDLWRLSTAEQSLVAITFKNTFRDYYAREGMQLHGGIRPPGGHELVASFRWDTHKPLANESDASLFRRDREFRPNRQVAGADLNAVVLGYSFDSRGLGSRGVARAFEDHLVDDLFRGSRRQATGTRIDWTSEIAGRAMGGDYEFTRHIVNGRAYLPITPRQSIAARALLGFSDGALPIERRFAIGGIGTVHGYRFKEAVGEGMTLLNAEYRFDVTPGNEADNPALRALVFFDAGRVRRPFDGTTAEWLRGIGLGLQTGPFRVEFGFRLNDIPGSRQILVRLGPTF